MINEHAVNNTFSVSYCMLFIHLSLSM